LNTSWEMNYFLFISLMVLKLQTGKSIPSQIKH
jgi:hypothetical protein